MKPAVLFALALAACAARPAPTPQIAAPAGAVYAFHAESLAPRVHMLTQGDAFHLQPRGNVVVIEQGAGVVLVDSGGSPAAAEEVIAFVRALTPKPVTAIVVTHWHGDHTLGLSRLLQQWPQARVIATPGTQAMLTSPDADRFMPGDDPEANAIYMANIEGALEYLNAAAQDQTLSEADRAGFAQAAREYAQFGREMAQARRVPATETFTDRLVLADRDAPVEILFLGRANTAGDAIVWLPRQRVVATGDVVVAPIPYGFNTYPREWIAVLQQIRALDFAVLAPGHGAAQHDRAYLDRLIAMLSDVRAQAAPLAADATAETAPVNLDAERDAIAGDDPWLRRWFANYWKGPIVSSALREARGEEIVQGAQ